MINGHKIAACVALHYGREYIAWAIASVIDDVDELYVLYSPEGSHLTRTAERCPETRAELYALAANTAGDKLRWHDGDWTREGEQRDTIYTLTDASIIATLDADEIYAPGLLHQILQDYSAGKFTVRRLRLPMWHYYRSLKRVIKHDPAFPERVVFRDLPEGKDTYAIPAGQGEDFRIHHYGYAINPELMRYKWKIHGHLNELRKDCDWINDVFMTNRQTDCHPCGQKEWSAEPCDVMPFMANHPYSELDLIE